jgi:uncharacterized lipoprotein YddW (UPF0748 family)
MEYLFKKRLSIIFLDSIFNSMIMETTKKRLYGRRRTGTLIMAALTVVILFSGCGNPANQSSRQPQFQVRALWVDPPGIRDRKTVDRLVEKCQQAGINMILPDIMLRDEVWFQSENFIGKVHADEQYDPLGYLIEKAHTAGIQVQPWSCTYYSQPKHPDWNSQPFVSENYDHVFLSAAHPEVNPYLVSVLKELLKYDIDGIHLDYTRYWNAAFDYSKPARNRFKASYGFDPQDFYDHPERIVPPTEDPYPVNILISTTAILNIPTLGTLERNFNRTGVGYAYVSEKPARIDALRAPGLLVVSFYHDVSPEMAKALEQYVKRGGDIIWVCPNADLFEKNLNMTALTGVKGTRRLPTERVRLQISDDRFGKSIDTLVKVGGNSLVLEKADVVARLDTEEPVVTVYQNGKGRVVVLGLQVLYSDSPQLMRFLKDAIVGLRTQAGITGPDRMGEKREQWIDWRATHLKELMREVNKLLKTKNPKLPLTTASGVGPQQYHGIYRDSRELLSENIVDYIFPMNYTDRLDVLRDILDEQALYTPEGMSERIYPGIKLYTRENNVTVPMDAELVGKQLEMVKKYGYQGFCVFAYSYFSDEMVEVLQRYSQ